MSGINGVPPGCPAEPTKSSTDAPKPQEVANGGIFGFLKNKNFKAGSKINKLADILAKRSQIKSDISENGSNGISNLFVNVSPDAQNVAREESSPTEGDLQRQSPQASDSVSSGSSILGSVPTPDKKGINEPQSQSSNSNQIVTADASLTSPGNRLPSSKDAQNTEAAQDTPPPVPEQTIPPPSEPDPATAQPHPEQEPVDPCAESGTDKDQPSDPDSKEQNPDNVVPFSGPSDLAPENPPSSDPESVHQERNPDLGAVASDTSNVAPDDPPSYDPESVQQEQKPDLDTVASNPFNVAPDNENPPSFGPESVHQERNPDHDAASLDPSNLAPASDPDSVHQERIPDHDAPNPSTLPSEPGNQHPPDLIPLESDRDQPPVTQESSLLITDTQPEPDHPLPSPDLTPSECEEPTRPDVLPEEPAPGVEPSDPPDDPDDALHNEHSTKESYVKTRSSLRGRKEEPKQSDSVVKRVKTKKSLRRPRLLVETSTQTADVEFISRTADTLPFVCLHCHQTFSEIRDCRTHEVTHTQKRKTKFIKCQFCSRKLPSLDELKSHARRVHVDCFHYCESCDVRLASDALLVRHREKEHLEGQGQSTNVKRLKPVGANLDSDGGFDGSKKSSSPRHLQKPPKTEEQIYEAEMLFYSHLSGNIQENLSNHLDGKIDRNDVPVDVGDSSDNRTKNGGTLSVPAASNGTTPSPVLRAPSPYQTRSKTPNALPTTAKKFKKLPNWQQKFWEKYNFPTNYRFEHRFWDKNYLNTERSALYLKDLSCLDIKTQLTLRENAGKLEECKEQHVSEQTDNQESFLSYLNLVPDAALPESADQSSEKTMTDTPVPTRKKTKPRKCRMVGEAKVLTRRQNGLNERKQRKGSLDLGRGDKMTLRRQSSMDHIETKKEGPTDDRLKNAEEPDTSEIENSVISGEWVRSRSYFCGTCCDKFTNLWELEDHKWTAHPNVYCSHYEFDDDKVKNLFKIDADTPQVAKIKLPDLYRRSLRPEGSLTTTESQPGLSFPHLCSKCEKSCHNLPDLHKHMLDCGGDTTWSQTMHMSPGTMKRKWKPFGGKRRKQIRRRGLKRTIPSTPTLRSYCTQPRIRTKPGDVESIQKMLANLPEKRTRRAINFDEINTRSQTTIQSNRLLRKRFNVTFGSSFLRRKALKAARQQQRRDEAKTEPEDAPAENSPRRRLRLKEVTVDLTPIVMPTTPEKQTKKKQNVEVSTAKPDVVKKKATSKKLPMTEPDPEETTELPKKKIPGRGRFQILKRMNRKVKNSQRILAVRRAKEKTRRSLRNKEIEEDEDSASLSTLLTPLVPESESFVETSKRTPGRKKGGKIKTVESKEEEEEVDVETISPTSQYVPDSLLVEESPKESLNRNKVKNAKVVEEIGDFDDETVSLSTLIAPPASGVVKKLVKKIPRKKGNRLKAIKLKVPKKAKEDEVNVETATPSTLGVPLISESDSIIETGKKPPRKSVNRKKSVESAENSDDSVALSSMITPALPVDSHPISETTKKAPTRKMLNRKKGLEAGKAEDLGENEVSSDTLISPAIEPVKPTVTNEKVAKKVPPRKIGRKKRLIVKEVEELDDETITLSSLIMPTVIEPVNETTTNDVIAKKVPPRKIVRKKGSIVKEVEELEDETVTLSSLIIPPVIEPVKETNISEVTTKTPLKKVLIRKKRLVVDEVKGEEKVTMSSEIIPPVIEPILLATINRTTKKGPLRKLSIKGERPTVEDEKIASSSVITPSVIDPVKPGKKKMRRRKKIKVKKPPVKLLSSPLTEMPTLDKVEPVQSEVLEKSEPNLPVLQPVDTAPVPVITTAPDTLIPTAPDTLIPTAPDPLISIAPEPTPMAKTPRFKVMKKRRKIRKTNKVSPLKLVVESDVTLADSKEVVNETIPPIDTEDPTADHESESDSEPLIALKSKSDVPKLPKAIISKKALKARKRRKILKPESVEITPSSSIVTLPPVIEDLTSEMQPLSAPVSVMVKALSEKPKRKPAGRRGVKKRPKPPEKRLRMTVKLKEAILKVPTTPPTPIGPNKWTVSLPSAENAMSMRFDLSPEGNNVPEVDVRKLEMPSNVEDIIKAVLDKPDIAEPAPLSQLLPLEVTNPVAVDSTSTAQEIVPENVPTAPEIVRDNVPAAKKGRKRKKKRKVTKIVRVTRSNKDSNNELCVESNPLIVQTTLEKIEEEEEPLILTEDTVLQPEEHLDSVLVDIEPKKIDGDLEPPVKKIPSKVLGTKARRRRKPFLRKKVKRVKSEVPSVVVLNAEPVIEDLSLNTAEVVKIEDNKDVVCLSQNEVKDVSLVVKDEINEASSTADENQAARIENADISHILFGKTVAEAFESTMSSAKSNDIPLDISSNKMSSDIANLDNSSEFSKNVSTSQPLDLVKNSTERMTDEVRSSTVEVVTTKETSVCAEADSTGDIPEYVIPRNLENVVNSTIEPEGLVSSTEVEIPKPTKRRTTSKQQSRLDSEDSIHLGELDRRSRRRSKEVPTTGEFIIDDPLLLVDELWSDLDSDSDCKQKKKLKRSKKRITKPKSKSSSGIDLEALLRNFGENKYVLARPEVIKCLPKQRRPLRVSLTTRERTERKLMLSTIVNRRLALRLFSFNKRTLMLGHRGSKLRQAKLKLLEPVVLPKTPSLPLKITENPEQVIVCRSSKKAQGKKANKVKEVVPDLGRTELRPDSGRTELRVSLPLELIGDLSILNNNHPDVESTRSESVSRSATPEIKPIEPKAKRSEVIDKIFYCEMCNTYYYSASQLKNHEMSNRHKLKVQSLSKVEEAPEQPVIDIACSSETLKLDKSGDDTSEMPVLEGPFIEHRHEPASEQSPKLQATPMQPIQPRLSGFSPESLKEIQNAIGCSDEEMLLLTLLGENNDSDASNKTLDGESRLKLDLDLVRNVNKSNGLKRDLKQQMTTALASIVNRAVSNILNKSTITKGSDAYDFVSKLCDSSDRRKTLLSLSDDLCITGESVEELPPSQATYKYQCTICGNRFEKESTRDYHLIRTHPTNRRSRSQKQPIEEMTPPSEDWNDFWFDNDEPVAVETGQFSCSDCGINFLSPAEVREHQQLEHAPEKSSVMSDETDESRSAAKRISDLDPDQERILANQELQKLASRKLQRKCRMQKTFWGLDALKFTVPKSEDQSVNEASSPVASKSEKQSRFSKLGGSTLKRKACDDPVETSSGKSKPVDVYDFNDSESEGEPMRLSHVRKSKGKGEEDSESVPIGMLRASKSKSDEPIGDEFESEPMRLPHLLSNEPIGEDSESEPLGLLNVRQSKDKSNEPTGEDSESEPFRSSHVRKAKVKRGKPIGKEPESEPMRLPLVRKSKGKSGDPIGEDSESEPIRLSHLLMSKGKSDEDSENEPLKLSSMRRLKGKSDELIEDESESESLKLRNMRKSKGKINEHSREDSESEPITLTHMRKSKSKNDESSREDSESEPIRLSQLSKSKSKGDGPISDESASESLLLSHLRKLKGKHDEPSGEDSESEPIRLSHLRKSQPDEPIGEDSESEPIGLTRMRKSNTDEPIGVEDTALDGLPSHKSDEEVPPPLLTPLSKPDPDSDGSRSKESALQESFKISLQSRFLRLDQIALKKRSPIPVKNSPVFSEDDDSIPLVLMSRKEVPLTLDDDKSDDSDDRLNENVIYHRNDSFSSDSDREEPTKASDSEASRSKTGDETEDDSQVTRNKRKIVPLLSATLPNRPPVAEKPKAKKDAIVRRIWSRKKAKLNSENEESQSSGVDKDTIMKRIWKKKKMDVDSDDSSRSDEVTINQTEVSDEVVIKCGPKPKTSVPRRKSTNEPQKDLIVRRIWSGKCAFQTKAALKTYDTDLVTTPPVQTPAKRKGRPNSTSTTKKKKVASASEDELDSLIDEIERENVEKAIRIEFLHMRRSERGGVCETPKEPAGLFAESMSSKTPAEKKRPKLGKKIRVVKRREDLKTRNRKHKKHRHRHHHHKHKHKKSKHHKRVLNKHREKYRQEAGGFKVLERMCEDMAQKGPVAACTPKGQITTDLDNLDSKLDEVLSPFSAGKKADGSALPSDDDSQLMLNLLT